MSKDPLVLIERRGTMGRITLNRPDARNPLDPAMAGAMVEALDRHCADPAVRSIVITGAGDAFCAGGNLRQMREFSTMPITEAYAWPEAIVASHKRMLAADKPVIAAVNGPAFAGGMGLAGMCDIVLALESASFAMPEVKIGLFPMIIVAHLARAIPRKHLLEMMMTGEPITAAEAHRLGFVNRVASTRDELEALIEQYGRKFEAVSPTAVALGRRAFTLLADLPAAQALDAAQFLNLPFFMGDDLQEGASAFLEKRPPRWREPG
jgi:enoyl-CoA hydratase/carnithine racemase